MNEHDTEVDEALTAQEGRTPWTAPKVTVLSLGETANNATVGNDGAGPTTGS